MTEDLKASIQRIMAKLRVPPSQMPETFEDDWIGRLVSEREEALAVLESVKNDTVIREVSERVALARWKEKTGMPFLFEPSRGDLVSFLLSQLREVAHGVDVAETEATMFRRLATAALERIDEHNRKAATAALERFAEINEGVGQ